MIDRRPVSHFLIADTLEILSAPESDENGVVLTICRNIPRILDEELEPDIVGVIAMNIPFEDNIFTFFLVIWDNFDLHGVKEFHFLVVQCIMIDKPD